MNNSFFYHHIKCITATNDSINYQDHQNNFFKIIHQIISTVFSTYNHQISIKSFALHLSVNHVFFRRKNLSFISNLAFQSLTFFVYINSSLIFFSFFSFHITSNQLLLDILFLFLLFLFSVFCQSLFVFFASYIDRHSLLCIDAFLSHFVSSLFSIVSNEVYVFICVSVTQVHLLI